MYNSKEDEFLEKVGFCGGSHDYWGAHSKFTGEYISKIYKSTTSP
jgi:hypothetical protein